MNEDSQGRAAAVLTTAHAQLRAGALGDAQRLLRSALDGGVFGDPPEPEAVLALRLLGQATRQLGDLEAAAAIYEDARRIARSFASPRLESIAVEGLALVARADDEQPRALALYDEAAHLALDGGDPAGHAAVLSNKGNLLIHMERYEEAEAVLREAVSCEEFAPVQKAAAEDNLAGALGRMGRLEEAIEMAEGAISTFERSGAGIDRYVALRNLEEFHRQLGQTDEAAQTFVAAHELIAALEIENLDRDHYRAFPERARAIEEETTRKLDSDDMASALDIGVHATLGIELGNEADKHFEAGEYRAAEEALYRALEHWQHLGAHHQTPRIHQALGMVYTETGQRERALRHLLLSREIAHMLGDAYREMSTCANLCRFALDVPEQAGELDPMQLIARARALHPLAVEQLIGPVPEGAPEPPMEGGVIDTLDTSNCVSHGAWDLAERFARRSVETIEETFEKSEEDTSQFHYRLGLRLTKLYTILRNQGKDQDADALEIRLDQILKEDDNARLVFSVHAILGGERFAHDLWDEETFRRLCAACDAYERARVKAQPIGELSDFTDLFNPPFDEAIEVAVKLGRNAEALHLLERSKARSLLDDLAVGESTLAESAGALAPGDEKPPELQPLAQPASAEQLSEALARRSGDPLLIEFFIGPRNILAFTLDAGGELGVHRLGDSSDERWTELMHLVYKNALSGEGAALQALRDSALRELSSFIQTAAGDRPAFVCPHRALHALPLHLMEEDGNGTLTPRPRTFHLPSGSLLRLADDPEELEGSLVAGDPLSDLPFAALEASAVAERFQIEPTLGDACTPSWLASELERGHRPLRLVHLACHALFHPRRGERSGLVLTDGGAPAVVSVRDVAALDWTADLLVLSACSSGQQQVREGDELAGLARTMLGRGARALIAALWEVSDLSTYLLVEDLYARLPQDRGWDLETIGAALVSAQRGVRDSSARDLLDLAIRLHERADATGDDSLSHCALSAAATAHRAAGNREESLRCYEAIACLRENREPAPDIGAFDWSGQAELGQASGYAAQPFADPVNWAAFVLVGRG